MCLDKGGQSRVFGGKGTCQEDAVRKKLEEVMRFEQPEWYTESRFYPVFEGNTVEDFSFYGKQDYLGKAEFQKDSSHSSRQGGLEPKNSEIRAFGNY